MQESKNDSFSVFFFKGLDADRSGDLCHRALDLAQDLVKPSGSVLLKIFTGRCDDVNDF